MPRRCARPVIDPVTIVNRRTGAQPYHDRGRPTYLIVKYPATDSGRAPSKRNAGGPAVNTAEDHGWNVGGRGLRTEPDQAEDALLERMKRDARRAWRAMLRQERQERLGADAERRSS